MTIRTLINLSKRNDALISYHRTRWHDTYGGVDPLLYLRGLWFIKIGEQVSIAALVGSFALLFLEKTNASKGPFNSPFFLFLLALLCVLFSIFLRTRSPYKNANDFLHAISCSRHALYDVQEREPAGVLLSPDPYIDVTELERAINTLTMANELLFAWQADRIERMQNAQCDEKKIRRLRDMFAKYHDLVHSILPISKDVDWYFSKKMADC